MDPLAGLDEGFFGTAKHEKAFETLIQGTGGTGDLQEEYAKVMTQDAIKTRGALPRLKGAAHGL